MTPCLLGGKHENRRQQSAERLEDFVHPVLRGATAWRIRRVAVHSIFGDVDVKTAQVDRAKLIERMINLVELERFICGSAIGDQVIKSLQNPERDQRSCS